MNGRSRTPPRVEVEGDVLVSERKRTNEVRKFFVNRTEPVKAGHIGGDSHFTNFPRVRDHLGVEKNWGEGFRESFKTIGLDPEKTAFGPDDDSTVKMVLGNANVASNEARFAVADPWKTFRQIFSVLAVEFSVATGGRKRINKGGDHLGGGGTTTRSRFELGDRDIFFCQRDRFFG